MQARLPTAVAIGNFDGVHRGHQALLAKVRELAVTDGCRATAFTFSPHPTAVLAPERAPAALCSLERRIELLGCDGAVEVVVQPFTAEFASRSRSEFLAHLRDTIAPRHIVVGHDFSYGHRRSGTVLTLAADAQEIGATAHVLPAVRADGVILSSTSVRLALKAGDMRLAAATLGRWFDIDGVVVHGAKRGRQIGVPTANIATDIPLPVPTGIYAVRLRVGDGKPLDAVASIGTNPTFVTNGGVTFEVHVLDFDGDLYDRRVRVELIERLRNEETYAGIEPLLAQIRMDIANSRQVLASVRNG